MKLVELGTIIEITKGKKPLTQSPVQKDGFLPYIDIKAFETGAITSYADGEKCTPCDDGDILIVCDGSRSGLVGIAQKGYVGSTLAKISAKDVDNRYLYRYLQGKYTLLNTNKKGTGTPHLKADLLKKQRIILCSFEEQQRILENVESELSKLDEAVETLKNTKQQLGIYRQAVLKDAFEGKYTPDVPMHEITMNEIADGKDGLRRGPFGSAIKKAFFVESGYKVYEQGNAINDDYKRGNYYISEEKYNELSSFQLKPGDFIVSCSGTIGKIAQLPADAEAGVINQALMRIRLKPDIIEPYYFMMQFRSDVFQRKIVSRGSEMGNLAGVKEFRTVTMFVPDNYENQRIIVAEIESRMSVCDNIEHTVDAALQQAEALRQSILKQAFEGEE